MERAAGASLGGCCCEPVGLRAHRGTTTILPSHALDTPDSFHSCRAAPETDAELDGLEDTDRDLLEALSETLKEVLDGELVRGRQGQECFAAFGGGAGRPERDTEGGAGW